MADNEAAVLTADDMQTIVAPSLASQHARVRGFFTQLAVEPPQVLLLEGGTVDDRVSMALYWAALLNCRAGKDTPCFSCESCVQMCTRNSRDIFFLDGRENAIKIEQVREIRGVLGEPPRGEGKRVIILAEAQSLGIEAANALLKSLEEPRPGTRFVLLAPQRERLLPTLVSRSWVLTLAWPEACPPDADVAEWVSALATFLRENSGWFAKTSARGGLDRPLAQRFVTFCQQELAAAMAARSSGELAEIFSSLSIQHWRILDEALAECQDSLNSKVNPALVLDWLATRLSLLLRSFS